MKKSLIALSSAVLSLSLSLPAFAFVAPMSNQVPPDVVAVGPMSNQASPDFITVDPSELMAPPN